MNARIKKTGSYHHGDLKQALLSAAVEVIEAGGVDALTLRSLASRAGVSSGAPYHHFESRDLLLAAIAETGLRGLAAEMRCSSEAAIDTRARLEGLGRGYVKFALAHRGHFRVMFRPELREILGEQINRELAEGLRMLRNAVVECQKAGFAADKDTNGIVLLAWSAMHGACQLWIDGTLADVGLATDEEALAAGVVDTLVALVYARKVR
jgi:AcrR family transcriptional regulator